MKTRIALFAAFFLITGAHAQLEPEIHDEGLNDPANGIQPIQPGPTPWVPPIAPPPKPVFGQIEGYVTYYPDFRYGTDGKPFPDSEDWGEVPRADDYTSGMPKLFVCAYDRDGTVDFMAVDPTADPNDDLLGCARTGPGGYYSIEVERFPVEQLLDLYLVTWFCSAPVETISVPDTDVEYPGTDRAVCVRLNSEENGAPYSAWSDEGRSCNMGNCEPCDEPGAAGCGPDQAGRKTKYMHSAVYEDLWDGDYVFLNWNLSCPAEFESNDLAVYHPCNEVLPGGAINGAASNFGYNKEVFHMFRSAVQPDWPLRPTPSNVADGQVPCGAQCDRAHEFFLRPAINPSNAAGDLWCEPEGESFSGNNYSLHDGSGVCILEGIRGAFNPFRTVHEMGHSIHRRWMEYDGSLQDGCPSTAWAASGSYDHDCDKSTDKITWSGPEQKVAFSEAWANFYSTAAWFDRSAPNARYGSLEMEDRFDSELFGSNGPSLPPTCAGLRGEGRQSQFLWDLYDDPPNDDENVTTTFTDMLRVLSRFDPELENREYRELGENGRNVADFVYHYKQEIPYNEFDLGDAMDWNCMQFEQDSETKSSAVAGDPQCPNEPGANSCP